MKIAQIRLEGLRREIDVGYRDIDAGRVATYTEKTLPDLVNKIQRVGRARLASSAKKAGAIL